MSLIRVVAIILISGLALLAQEQAVQLDEFGPQTNDSLMARVEHFAVEISKRDSSGFAVVKGTPLMKHLIRRKIEGCLRWRGRPIDQFRFVWGDAIDHLEVQFWSAPKGFQSNQFSTTTFDYTLPPLTAPIELSSSQSTDEYCPNYFDIEWYSRFLGANPLLTGKVVIDTSRHDFTNRVVKYREQLASLGIKSTRVTFLRRKFEHERDEQWWLIPANKASTAQRSRS
jgi:hypothetical protein